MSRSGSRSKCRYLMAATLGCSLLAGCTSSPSTTKTAEAAPAAPAGGEDPPPLEAAPSAQDPDDPTGVRFPVETEASKAAHASVQEQLNGGPLLPNPLVHDIQIEDPSGTALDTFHAALRDHDASTDPSAKLRVAMYGASSVAADRYTAYMRGYMQARFGDGGIGFVALVPIWKWHRHDAVTVKASRHWAIEHAQRKTGKLDGHYGILGASAHSANKRAWAELRGRRNALNSASDSDSVRLLYLLQPGGGSFRVKSAKSTIATVSTKGDAFAAGAHDLEIGDDFLPLRLEVVGNGEVRLFGAILENDERGVVVDALGIGGTRAANITLWTDGIWTTSLKERAPSLFVLAYGANESVDEDEPIETYQVNLETVMGKFRNALPQASCVLIGPVDFPRRDEETQAWIPRPRIDQIIGVQRAVAAATGCGFFDSRKLTGGPGTMDAWATAEPPLAKSDHLHLSTYGYLEFGRTFVNALMGGYDESADRP